MFRFDEPSHTYTLGEQVLPSVTQILKPLSDFSMIPPAVLEHARARGVAVHRCVQLDINDDLVEESVAPEIAGYLVAWRQFREDCGITEADVGEPERPLFHPVLRYAGTPDVPLWINERWSVLDIKTADTWSPVWPLQLAAYRELLNVNTLKGEHLIEDRYSLRLRENGTYRLDQAKDRNDWSTFLAMLTVHRWRAANIKGD